MAAERLHLILALCTLVGVPSPARALSSYGLLTATAPGDARSEGMGNACTAASDGPASGWWNPGALSLQNGVSFQPYSGIGIGFDHELDVHSYAVSAGRDGRGFGANLCHVNYRRFMLTDDSGMPIGHFSPTEYTLRLGAGVDLARYLRSGSNRIGLGANLMYCHAKAHPRYTGTGWDFDLGILAVHRWARGGPAHEDPRGTGGSSGYSGLSGGLVYQGLLNREIKYGNRRGLQDPLGRSVRGGLAWEWAAGVGSITALAAPVVRVQVAADLDQPLGEHGYRTAKHLGVEGTLLGIWTARWGYVDDYQAQISNPTYGFGLGFDLASKHGRFSSLGARLDYASVPVTVWVRDRYSHYTVSAWSRF